MTSEHELRKALAGVPLGDLRYFERTGSTNDAALAWATEGAPDLALVCAEEQTTGRGRGSRRWFTPPGAALAFSLVLRPSQEEQGCVPRFSGLGALAVVAALEELKLSPEIKWPNDVLVGRRKVCGILVESVWAGEKVDSLVVGIGLNVRPQAVPPAAQLNFPATSLEAQAGRSVDRPGLLRSILEALIRWRPLLPAGAFLQAWEDHLAFRGEQVVVSAEGQTGVSGQVEGLEQDGSLRLRNSQGEVVALQLGEVHLRPVV